MDQRMRNSLDNYITGNYGEGQLRREDLCEGCGEEVATEETVAGLLCRKCAKGIAICEDCGEQMGVVSHPEYAGATPEKYYYCTNPKCEQYRIPH